jgi:hypothetical protein
MAAIAGSGFWGGGGVDEEAPPPHAHSRIAVRHKNRPTHKYSQKFRGWSCRTMSTSQFVVVNKIRYENIVKMSKNIYSARRKASNPSGNCEIIGRVTPGVPGILVTATAVFGRSP